MSSISTIDLVFFVVAFIFILTAFLRGFVKEIFAILNWIMAIVLSHLLAPYASKLVMFYTKNTLVADISSRTILFIVVFIITMLATSSLSESLQEKTPKMFDKSLGILFGVIKTTLIFGLIYSAILNVGAFATGDKKYYTPQNFKPKWLTDAKTYNIIRFSGAAIDPVVKIFLDDIIKNFEKNMPKNHLLEGGVIDDLDAKIGEVVDDKISGNATEDSKSATDKDAGYSKKDIQKMDHLIDIVK